MMTYHQQAVTKEKVQKAVNKHCIAQHVVNQTTMPASVKLNTNSSVNSAIRKDMQ